MKKGGATEIQTRQAKGALAQARASVPVLEAGLGSAMNAMDVMLGVSPGTHRAAIAAFKALGGGWQAIGKR